MNDMLQTLALMLLGQQAQTPTLESILAELEGKGYSAYVRVEQFGKPIYERSIGYTNKETKTPWSATSVIEIGSIVKPMSQIALIKLASEGKLSLDDPIGKYLALTGDKAPLTLAQVMSHTAGLADVFGDDYDPMTKEQLIEKVNASKLLFKPGERDEYSNCGYSLLAMVIERVAGVSFEDHRRANEFLKIDTPSIGYIRPQWQKEAIVRGYRKDGTDWGTPLEHFWYPDGPTWTLRGNGGMLCLATDLTKWARAVGKPGYMTAAELATWKPQVYGSDARPGAGWASAGGNGIFDTVIYYWPSRDASLLACSNIQGKEIEDRIKDISTAAKALLGPMRE